jgi:hypothetical protein
MLRITVTVLAVTLAVLAGTLAGLATYASMHRGALCFEDQVRTFEGECVAWDDIASGTVR